MDKREHPNRSDLCLGILFTLTVLAGPVRGAVVGMAIGLAYLLYQWVTPKRVIISLALLTAVAAVTPTNLVYRRLRLNEENYRFRIWKVAYKTILDHPITWDGDQVILKMALHSICFSR